MNSIYKKKKKNTVIQFHERSVVLSSLPQNTTPSPLFITLPRDRHRSEKYYYFRTRGVFLTYKLFPSRVFPFRRKVFSQCFCSSARSDFALAGSATKLSRTKTKWRFFFLSQNSTSTVSFFASHTNKTHPAKKFFLFVSPRQRLAS